MKLTLILIATPGRLTYLLLKIKVKLDKLKNIVYDEADKLFEFGYSSQLQLINKLTPPRCQIMLFSATLPENLFLFLNTELKSPKIIRLDTEIKINNNIENQYIFSKEFDKQGVLFYLLKFHIPKQQQTILFIPTRHHAEYFSLFLTHFGISNVSVFGSMNYFIRRNNIGKFRSKKLKVLIVTDLASRGIDIPSIKNIINFNFPTKFRIYLHRVGRIARAGSYGKVWNIVGPFDRAYMCEIFKFLTIKVGKDDYNSRCGCIPSSILYPNILLIKNLLSKNIEVKKKWKILAKAEKNYKKFSNLASKISITEAKNLNTSSIHPIFLNLHKTEKNKRGLFLKRISSYRNKKNMKVFSDQK